MNHAPGKPGTTRSADCSGWPLDAHLAGRKHKERPRAGYTVHSVVIPASPSCVLSARNLPSFDFQSEWWVCRLQQSLALKLYTVQVREQLEIFAYLSWSGEVEEEREQVVDRGGTGDHA